MRNALLAIATLIFGATLAAQQQPPASAQPQPPKAKPEETEIWGPVPAVVTPGTTDSAPPSDATVLFDGKNLNEWVSVKDKTPATWTIADGILTVDKKGGNIETKRSFKNYQIHLEWRVPTDVTGEGQARGNSGLFLASTGNENSGYEMQILDSY